LFGALKKNRVRKVILPPFTHSNYFFNQIYLGYSAAIPGKLLDHLAFWPLQRQPWHLQKTSIQQLQTGFDENN